MGIFDIFRRTAQAGETKASATGATLAMNPGQPEWTPREYDKLAKEGYELNVIAYQAINKVAEACASVEPLLFRGDNEITESPLLTLLKSPSPKQSFSQYVQAAMGFYQLSGNLYQERIMVGATPREIYPLRPDRMKVIPSADGWPAGYVYSANGKKTTWDVNPKTLDSDISHTKTFHPLNDWYGLSPIEAAAWSIDMHNAASVWVKSLLKNSARPSGALVTSGGNDLTDEQFARLKAQVDEQHAGAMNAGRPMLLEGGLDWKSMGLSPTDMGILEGKNASARDICLAFGVPPQLLGIPGDNTYSNYQEARLAFWEDTVIPLLGVLYGSWNAWLAPSFGEGLELRPNLDEVPAIVANRMKLWEMADASQDLTVNERRELKGYGPTPGGDVLMQPQNALPMNSALNDMDAEAAKSLAYGDNVTPLDRKAK